MREYWDETRDIIRSLRALRKEKSILPNDPIKIANSEKELIERLTKFDSKWPDLPSGDCSCKETGYCIPKPCANRDCDMIIEGTDFCNQDCFDAFLRQTKTNPS